MSKGTFKGMKYAINSSFFRTATEALVAYTKGDDIWFCGAALTHTDLTRRAEDENRPEYDKGPEKWGMSPLQVLCRAWERVSAGTHKTAQEAVGCESARDAIDGSPITKAWGLLCDAFGNTRVSEEEHEKAYLAYQAISDFGQKPNKEGELEALKKAIEIAKIDAMTVEEHAVYVRKALAKTFTKTP